MRAERRGQARLHQLDFSHKRNLPNGPTPLDSHVERLSFVASAEMWDFQDCWVRMFGPRVQQLVVRASLPCGARKACPVLTLHHLRLKLSVREDGPSYRSRLVSSDKEELVTKLLYCVGDACPFGCKLRIWQAQQHCGRVGGRLPFSFSLGDNDDSTSTHERCECALVVRSCWDEGCVAHNQS